MQCSILKKATQTYTINELTYNPSNTCENYNSWIKRASVIRTDWKHRYKFWQENSPINQAIITCVYKKHSCSKLTDWKHIERGVLGYGRKTELPAYKQCFCIYNMCKDSSYIWKTLTLLTHDRTAICSNRMSQWFYDCKQSVQILFSLTSCENKANMISLIYYVGWKFPYTVTRAAVV